MRFRWFSKEPDPDSGRYHAMRYAAHPWYVKPTFSARWGFEALRTRLWVGILPGDQGSEYMPKGYLIPELGPKAMMGKGTAEMEVSRLKLRTRLAPPCCKRPKE